jgi:hypothetical protein
MAGKRADKLDIAVNKYVDNVYKLHTPKYTWYMALVEGGYAESTARAKTAELWLRAEQGIEKAKTKLEAKAKWDIDWLDEQARILYDDCRTKLDNTNAKGVLDLMYKRKGAFVQITKDVTDLPTIPESDTKLIEEQTRLLNIKLASTKAGP